MPYQPPLDYAVVTNRPSSSAFALRRALGHTARVIRSTRARWHVRYEAAINWGCTSGAAFESGPVLNRPGPVLDAVDKVRFFEATARLPTVVPATTFKATVKEWLSISGSKVMCRTNIRSHSGNGIVVARTVDDLVDAPLYTLYVKKVAEFRAHVMGGKVIALQQKRRRSGDGYYDPLVRSSSRGWVYTVNNVNTELLPADWEDTVITPVRMLGLDFGAVDFCVTEGGVIQIFEVNTAPGLTSPTVLDAYVRSLRSL